MRLFNEKEAQEYLGYSVKGNILAKMRMKTNQGKWEFTPRFIKFNDSIRYPKEWLHSKTSPALGLVKTLKTHTTTLIIFYAHQS